MSSDPHRGQPILRRGAEPARARLAVICIHGRGASAEDILTVADELELDDVAYLAPQAVRGREHVERARQLWHGVGPQAREDVDAPQLAAMAAEAANLAGEHDRAAALVRRALEEPRRIATFPDFSASEAQSTVTFGRAS